MFFQKQEAEGTVLTDFVNAAIFWGWKRYHTEPIISWMGNLYLCLKAVMTVIHKQCIAIAIALMKMRGKPWTAITNHH